MNRFNKYLIIVFVIMIISFMTGCSNGRINSEKLKQEQETYQNKVIEFFDMLKDNDSEKLKSLFSKNTIDNCEELEENINCLIEFYSSDENEFLFVPIISESLKEDGKESVNVESVFPIINSGIYYWVYFSFTYIDEFDSSNIGITQVNFYTSDEYYIFYHSNEKIEKSVGLNLYIENTLEDTIICINNYPQLYKSTGNILDIEEVEEYLKNNKSINEFVSTFGEYNCKATLVDSLENYYYEVTFNGEKVYLELSCDNGKIDSARLYNDRDWLKTIL